MKKIRNFLFCVGLCTAGLIGLTSCGTDEQPLPSHTNQLKELEEYEYSEYFSSLVEFGYKTETTLNGEDFIATTDAYITDLMSEEGVTYCPKEYVPENQKTASNGSPITEGTAFRLHFKGGRRIAKIEFDFVPSDVNYKILSNVVVYSSWTEEENFRNQCGATLVNESSTPLISMSSGVNHLFYNFYYEKNGLCKRDIGWKAENSLSDAIIFKFCQGRDFDTYASYGITISNLKITML